MNEIIELILNNTNLNLNTLCILCGGIASVPVSIATVSVKTYFGNKKQNNQTITVNNINLPSPHSEQNPIVPKPMEELVNQMINEINKEHHG